MPRTKKKSSSSKSGSKKKQKTEEEEEVDSESGMQDRDQGFDTGPVPGADKDEENKGGDSSGKGTSSSSGSSTVSWTKVGEVAEQTHFAKNSAHHARLIQEMLALEVKRYATSREGTTEATKAAWSKVNEQFQHGDIDPAAYFGSIFDMVEGVTSKKDDTDAFKAKLLELASRIAMHKLKNNTLSDVEITLSIFELDYSSISHAIGELIGSLEIASSVLVGVSVTLLFTKQGGYVEGCYEDFVTALCQFLLIFRIPFEVGQQDDIVFTGGATELNGVIESDDTPCSVEALSEDGKTKQLIPSTFFFDSTIDRITVKMSSGVAVCESSGFQFSVYLPSLFKIYRGLYHGFLYSDQSVSDSSLSTIAGSNVMNYMTQLKGIENLTRSSLFTFSANFSRALQTEQRWGLISYQLAALAGFSAFVNEFEKGALENLMLMDKKICHIPAKSYQGSLCRYQGLIIYGITENAYTKFLQDTAKGFVKGYSEPQIFVVAREKDQAQSFTLSIDSPITGAIYLPKKPSTELFQSIRDSSHFILFLSYFSWYTQKLHFESVV